MDVHPFSLAQATIQHMPKVSRVGRFRASGRDVKQAPLLNERSGEKVTAAEAASPKLLDSEDGATASSKDKSKIETTISVDANTTAAGTNGQGLSRGQRKRLAKREQYLKREKMVMASLKLKRQDEQKGKLDGLDALREALLSSHKPGKGGGSKSGKEKSESTAPQPARCSTNRAKKNLAGREVAHMNLVLEHPSFKANPFATLQEHLRNTLSGQADELKKTAETETAKEKTETAERKKAKKEKIRDLGGKKSLIRKKKRLAKQQQRLQAETSGRGSKRSRRR
jgi:hypothetical protein